MTTTPLLEIEEMTQSQASKYVTFNEAIRLIEGFTIRVLSQSNSGPPGSPSDGDAYIVDSATGTWSGFAVKDIALYLNTTWHGMTPFEGMGVWVVDENKEYVYDGSNWIPKGREAGIALLSSTTAGMQESDGKTNLFTVPTGKKCIVSHVVVRDPTGPLGSDYDFGDGANADTWKTAVDLSSLNTTVNCQIINNTNEHYVFDASDVFGIKPAVGVTTDYDAIIDVFGYLYDA